MQQLQLLITCMVHQNALQQHGTAVVLLYKMILVMMMEETVAGGHENLRTSTWPAYKVHAPFPAHKTTDIQRLCRASTGLAATWIHWAEHSSPHQNCLTGRPAAKVQQHPAR